MSKPIPESLASTLMLNKNLLHCNVNSLLVKPLYWKFVNLLTPGVH